MKRIFLCAIAVAMVLIATAQQQYAEDIPHATLAGKSSGSITMDEISTAGKLQVSSPSLQIVNFALTMIRDGVLISRVSHSNRISSVMLDQLKRLDKGQKFIVDEIQAMKTNGQVVNLKPLKFTLN